MPLEFIIPTERQGQTGMGQGGFACHQLQQLIGEPVTIALKSALPLETVLTVEAIDDGWRLVDLTAPDTTILEAARWEPDWPQTEPVSIQTAEAAREAFPVTSDDHPAPHCVSCGFEERSLHVHAGPMADGRWATPLRFPEWSLIDGRVDESLIWMAIDCACGWYTTFSGTTQGRGLTVQFAAETTAPLDPNADYALVAWNGDFMPDWDGRKRGAAAAIFDAEGACVARSRSFWVRPRT